MFIPQNKYALTTPFQKLIAFDAEGEGGAGAGAGGEGAGAGADGLSAEAQAQIDAYKAKAQKAEGESIERRKKLGAWAELGVTPDEVKEMLAAKQKAEEDKAKAEGDFDAILKQKQEKWDAEKAELTGSRDSAVNALQTFVADAAFTADLAKGKANAEGLSALPKLFENRIKVGFENGKPQLQIMMADGETPMAGSATDGSATMADLVAEAQKSFPSLFETGMKSGGGTPPNTGDAGRGANTNGTGKLLADKVSGFSDLPLN